jgi:hypothetical protein
MHYSLVGEIGRTEMPLLSTRVLRGCSSRAQLLEIDPQALMESGFVGDGNRNNLLIPQHFMRSLEGSPFHVISPLEIELTAHSNSNSHRNSNSHHNITDEELARGSPFETLNSSEQSASGVEANNNNVDENGDLEEQTPVAATNQTDSAEVVSEEGDGGEHSNTMEGLQQASSSPST